MAMIDRLGLSAFISSTQVSVHGSCQTSRLKNEAFAGCRCDKWRYIDMGDAGISHRRHCGVWPVKKSSA